MCMCYRWSWPWLLSADGCQTWARRIVSCDLSGESYVRWLHLPVLDWLHSALAEWFFCVYFSHKRSQLVLSFVLLLPPLRRRGRLESSLWKLLLINSEREREKGRLLMEMLVWLAEEKAVSGYTRMLTLHCSFVVWLITAPCSWSWFISARYSK